MRTALLLLVACNGSVLDPSQTTGQPDCDEASKIDVYPDQDGDGWGDEAAMTRACAVEAGFVLKPGDCDDSDAALSPDDGDGDGYSGCDGDCDDSNSSIIPEDLDGDGFTGCDGDCDDGDPELTPMDGDGDGYSTCDGDCSDVNPDVNPADVDGDGYSICDYDCDDEDPFVSPADLDGDGVSTCDGDCDDTDGLVFPGAVDTCYDGIDQDCDGMDDPCRTEFELGNPNGTIYNGTTYFRGHVFSPSTAVTIVDFGWYLGLSGSCNVDFYVHESTSSSGPWTVLYSGTVNSSGTAMHWSGPISVATIPGNYVGLGVGWNCTADYYGNAGVYAGPWPLGTFERTYWDNSYPGYSASYSPPDAGGLGGGTAYYMAVGYQ